MNDFIELVQLESVVKLIGCLVVAAIIFAIPCLATLAWVLNWDAFLRYLCIAFLIGEIVITAAGFYGSID